MVKTIVITAILAFLGLGIPAAQAHLVTKPKNDTLKAQLASQTENLKHAKYVCRNGKARTKKWHCTWVPILVKERAQTRRYLYPPQPKTYIAPYPWHNIAICESSLGTGYPQWSIRTGNGYYGGLQFDYGTWHEAQANLGIEKGDKGWVEYADRATPSYQVRGAMTLPLTRWPDCGAPYR